MSKELDGKTALVTGSSRGIGRAIAERLAASGALVAVNYAANHEAAEDVVATIRRAGGDAFAVQSELGSEESFSKLAQGVQDGLVKLGRDGSLDILVNNIGGGSFGKVADTSFELFEHTFSNNVRVPFMVTKALMGRVPNGGHVINISSVASRMAGVDFAVYSMSKAALDMFTKVLAKDLGSRQIRVNSVAPGITATDVKVDLSDPEVAKEFQESTAFGRVGEPRDMAELVHALVTGPGNWVTGQIIEASGGFRM